MLFTIDKPFKDDDELTEKQKDAIKQVEDFSSKIIDDIKNGKSKHINIDYFHEISNGEYVTETVNLEYEVYSYEG